MAGRPVRGMEKNFGKRVANMAGADSNYYASGP